MTHVRGVDMMVSLEIRWNSCPCPAIQRWLWPRVLCWPLARKVLTEINEIEKITFKKMRSVSGPTGALLHAFQSVIKEHVPEIWPMQWCYRWFRNFPRRPQEIPHVKKPKISWRHVIAHLKICTFWLCLLTWLNFIKFLQRRFISSLEILYNHQ